MMVDTYTNNWLKIGGKRFQFRLFFTGLIKTKIGTSPWPFLGSTTDGPTILSLWSDQRICPGVPLGIVDIFTAVHRSDGPPFRKSYCAGTYRPVADPRNGKAGGLVPLIF